MKKTNTTLLEQCQHKQNTIKKTVERGQYTYTWLLTFLAWYMYSDKSGGVILVCITYTFLLIHIYMTTHIPSLVHVVW